MSGTGDELERLRRRAELAEVELERLASTVAHDLRNPLSSIVGYLELLRLRAGAVLNPEAEGFLQQAEKGARQLDRMLGGLRLLSRVDLDPQRVDVGWRAIVDAALSELADDLMPYVDAIVVAEALPSVRADALALRSAVRELLDNALRHHPEPPDARVVVRVSEGGALVVEDDGAGLTAERAERFLEPFQGAGRLGPHGGVGLALARRIAEAHGGTLSVGASTLGGLRVSLRIGT